MFQQERDSLLSFMDNGFDAIIAFKVYCYIPHRTIRIEYLRELWRVLKPGGLMLMTHYVTPTDALESARDEYYQQIAPAYSTLEAGDYFPAGRGYVHWFSVKDLEAELRGSPFRLQVFCDDRAHGGAGYVYLALMRKENSMRRICA